jgi:hypothetical protein
MPPCTVATNHLLSGEDALRHEVPVIELVVFGAQERDLGPVGVPAGLAGIVGDLRPLAAVRVHDIEVADLLLALALVAAEDDPRAVRGGLGVELVDVGGVRQVHRVRPVGVHDPEVPVAAAVALAEDLVLHRLEFLEQLLGVALGERRGGGLRRRLQHDVEAREQKGGRRERQRVLAERRHPPRRGEFAGLDAVPEFPRGPGGAEFRQPVFEIIHGRDLPTSP